MAAYRETELYVPVKQFLEAAGYQVKGEVEGCDVVAVRGEELVVVELKLRCNLDLVLQGLARQRLGAAVYLATEAPRRRQGWARWRDVQALCRRLGLGLIAVQPGAARPVTVLVEAEVAGVPGLPARSGRRQTKHHRRRASLLEEFSRRSADHNTGGSSRRPLVTAYRERALWIAHFLAAEGPASVAQIRRATQEPASGAVLQRNVYGWFRRERRGVYALTASGIEALTLYADVVEALRKQRQDTGRTPAE